MIRKDAASRNESDREASSYNIVTFTAMRAIIGAMQ